MKFLLTQTPLKFLARLFQHDLHNSLFSSNFTFRFYMTSFLQSRIHHPCPPFNISKKLSIFNNLLNISIMFSTKFNIRDLILFAHTRAKNRRLLSASGSGRNYQVSPEVHLDPCLLLRSFAEGLGKDLHYRCDCLLRVKRLLFRHQDP